MLGLGTSCVYERIVVWRSQNMYTRSDAPFSIGAFKIRTLRFMSYLFSKTRSDLTL